MLLPGPTPLPVTPSLIPEGRAGSPEWRDSEGEPRLGLRWLRKDGTQSLRRTPQTPGQRTRVSRWSTDVTGASAGRRADTRGRPAARAVGDARTPERGCSEPANGGPPGAGEGGRLEVKPPPAPQAPPHGGGRRCPPRAPSPVPGVPAAPHWERPGCALAGDQRDEQSEPGCDRPEGPSQRDSRRGNTGPAAASPRQTPRTPSGLT